MALKLDGKKLALEIEDRLRQGIADELSVAGRPPGLAVIRVGDDPASGVYVSNKKKACERIGVASLGCHLPKGASSETVIKEIQSLNSNPLVDGILLQLPLPSGLDEGILLQTIDPDKDADGLHSCNLGKLLKGEKGSRSCTPAGVMALLACNNLSVESKRVVVIGRSILVGKPMALMLQSANATVTVAHSKTNNLPELTKEADLLVVAAGKPKMIGPEYIRPGSVVVDIGIHRIQSSFSSGDGSKQQLCGDVCYDEVEPIVSAITPVPGGVGPMTVAMLLVNTVNSWKNHCGLSLDLEDLFP